MSRITANSSIAHADNATVVVAGTNVRSGDELTDTSGELSSLARELLATPGALHPVRQLIVATLVGPYDSRFALDAIPEVGPHGDLTYSEYLRTDDWRQYRLGVLGRQKGLCAMCRAKATHCHHRHYVNLGWEADDDCIGVCAGCHARHHGKRRRR